MTRRFPLVRNFTRSDVVRSGTALANWLNPITGEPAAPLKTASFLESFTPSLMPRSSLHQGLAAGASLLIGDLVGRATDAALRKVMPPGAPFAQRVGGRAVVTGVGFGLTKIRQHPGEPTPVASLRTIGRLAMAGGIGGIAYESATELRTRYPATGALRPVIIAGGAYGGGLLYSNRLLENRRDVIKRWTDDEKPASLLASVAIAYGVETAGRLLGRAFLGSRSSVMDFFGDDPVRRQIGRAVNTTLWGVGLSAAYAAGVGYVARSNETIELAYRQPPENEFVSGGPKSISPFLELGLQGRRYVTDIVTPDLIKETLGEPADAHPVRAYVGYNSEPLYATGRSEMALEEMGRLGAFDRSYLLPFSPTGTGWVDQTMIESAEIFARGDIATICVQYGRSPSFLAVQKVALGRQQFRQLLWGIKQRMAERPPDRRPTVLVFGESLGAWSSSDVVMHQGIDGFDHYGIDKALWLGLPGLAKWSKTGMRDGSSDLVPEGTVAAFDRFEQLAELSDGDLENMRAVVLDHDNDPIAQVSFRLAVKQPEWLDPAKEKGRNVPEGMGWTPMLTFVQVAIDAMNAMKVIPGEFKSFGHDYRGDTARFVHRAYGFRPVTEEQMAQVEATLTQLELERGERIKSFKESDVDAATGAPARARGPKYLRDRGPGESGDAPIQATPGAASGDYQ
jgi:uncharacterized membrane protein